MDSYDLTRVFTRSRVIFKRNSWLVVSTENTEILYFFGTYSIPIYVCFGELWYNEQFWKIFHWQSLKFGKHSDNMLQDNFESWDICYFTVFYGLWECRYQISFWNFIVSLSTKTYTKIQFFLGKVLNFDIFCQDKKSCGENNSDGFTHKLFLVDVCCWKLFSIHYYKLGITEY